MKLSIVTINRNNAKGLEATLRSTLSGQRGFSDWEQIVIDGASTDSSMKVVDSYRWNERLAYVVSEPDEGIYDAMNKGAALAKGDYLLFLNSGDSLMPNALPRAFSVPWTADVAYGDLVYGSAPDAPVKTFPEGNSITPAYFLDGYLPHPSSLISRTLFERLGGYDTKYRIAADADFFLRAAVAPGTVFLHLSLAFSRFDTTGVSGSKKQWAKVREERVAYQGKVFGKTIPGLVLDGIRVRQINWKSAPETYLPEWRTAIRCIRPLLRKQLVKDPETRRTLLRFLDLFSAMNRTRMGRWLLGTLANAAERRERKILTLKQQVISKQPEGKRQLSETARSLRDFLDGGLKDGRSFGELADRFGIPAIVAALSELGPTAVIPLSRRLADNPCIKASRTSIRTIAFYVSVFRLGGAERVVSLLIPKFLEAGYGAVLFTDGEPQSDDYPLPPTVPRIVLCCGDKEMRTRRIQDAIERYGIDIYIHNSEYSPLMPGDLLAVKAMGVPFVAYCHGCFAGRLTVADPDIENAVATLSLADAAPVLSSDFERCYRALGVPAVCVRNPSTLKARETPAQLRDSEMILWVGRRAPIKNYLAPVRILARVLKRRPNASLVMVGAPRDNRSDWHIHRLAEKLDILEHVFVHPHADEIRPYYRAASVMLVTSVSEAAPMSVGEACAEGLPVVAYNLPYVEILKSCPAIPQVEFDDEEAAAGKVCELLENGKRWREQSEAERKAALDWEQTDMVAQWESVFSRIAAGDGFGRSASNGSSYGKIMSALLRMYSFGMQNRPTSKVLSILDRPVLPKSWKKQTWLARHTASGLATVSWKMRLAADCLYRNGAKCLAGEIARSLISGKRSSMAKTKQP